MVDLTVRNIVTHPFTAVTAVVGAISQVTTIPIVSALVATAMAKIGTLFTATAILSGTLAPQISWLPTRQLQIVTVVVGAVYAAKLLDGFWDSLKRRFNS